VEWRGWVEENRRFVDSLIWWTEWDEGFWVVWYLSGDGEFDELQSEENGVSNNVFYLFI
jgi:hypothetical protein